VNRAITDRFHQFGERGVSVRQAAESVSASQNEFYFHLAILKQKRAETLRSYFSRHRLKRILISSNLKGFGLPVLPRPVEHLEPLFFQEPDPRRFQEKCDSLHDSLVIVNNNDVGHHNGMPGYASFFSHCENTIFAAWDWDNHHWIEVSTFLAAHSDIYAPAHHENLFWLTRFNWLTVGPVYCAVVQWPEAFLAAHSPQIFSLARSDAPLGMHIPYAPFQFRLQAITTLHRKFPTIGFSEHSFHARTTEDRLQEWCAHKTHWIVPVLNDVPIRIFDALITGGIPIVPESLRFLPPITDIPRDAIVFYGPQDIIEPEAVVRRANELFDQGGTAKIAERHAFALNHHHGNTRIRQILGYAQEKFDLPLLP
jgi:hypothetical protein